MEIFGWELVIIIGSLRIKMILILKIRNHKISICSMLELPSEALYLLKKVQENLKYPWVEKKKVTEVLKQYEELRFITNYLK